MIRAAVVGGAGYAGGEVLRLLAGHPDIDAVQVTSERLAGKLVAAVHPPLRGRTELRFTSRDRSRKKGRTKCSRISSRPTISQPPRSRFRYQGISSVRLPYQMIRYCENDM